MKTLAIFTLFIISILFGFLTTMVVGKFRDQAAIQNVLLSKQDSVNQALKKVALSVRSDLLFDNIRSVRRTLYSLKNEDIFSGYEIYKDGIKVDSTFQDNEKQSEYLTSKIPVFFSENGVLWGEIVFFTSLKQIKKIEEQLTKDLAVSSILSAGVFSACVLLLALGFDILNRNLILLLGEKISGMEVRSLRIFRSIWDPVLHSFNEILDKNRKLQIENFRMKEIEIRTKIIAQIAHDIRSPVTALEIALRDTSGISGENRQLIEQASNRIKKISGDLLIEYKAASVSRSKIDFVNLKPDALDTFNISFSVQNIIIEKAAIYPNVQVITSGLESEYEIIGNESDFDRIFSNLLQNAIEACEHQQSPKVNVAIRKYRSKIQLSIIDNGKGIPTAIISQIGEEGFTHGKEKGNGLGVSFAKQKISEWGGEFSLSSSLGIGTGVSLTLNLKSENRC